MHPVHALPTRLWIQRCAQRIVELDRAIGEAEARRIARDLHTFERTRAMDPETAVEFAAAQISQSGPTTFERRRSHRG